VVLAAPLVDARRRVEVQVMPDGEQENVTLFTNPGRRDRQHELSGLAA